MQYYVKSLNPIKILFEVVNHSSTVKPVFFCDIPWNYDNQKVAGRNIKTSEQNKMKLSNISINTLKFYLKL